MGAILVLLLLAACEASVVNPLTPPSAATEPARITLAAPANVIYPGISILVEATVVDSAGRIVSDAPVTWVSSDPSVATARNGVVTGVSPGTCIIRASSGGAAAEVSVEVRSPVAMLSLADTAVNLEITLGGNVSAAGQDFILSTGMGEISGLVLSPVRYGNGPASGWLWAALKSHTTPALLKVGTNLGGLSEPGTYSAEIPLSAQNALGGIDTVIVAVKLIVRAAGGNQAQP